ncbi:hypothetical protein M5K25_021920 [Dendrobium thyrsiflorum]|uniref:Uncharacterized protein n=1 Tax=Dendrobium thyrsiflorum TaxID=117978 RepID=A0ABD0U5S6_DENTH
MPPPAPGGGGRGGSGAFELFTSPLLIAIRFSGTLIMIRVSLKKLKIKTLLIASVGKSIENGRALMVQKGESMNMRPGYSCWSVQVKNSKVLHIISIHSSAAICSLLQSIGPSTLPKRCHLLTEGIQYKVGTIDLSLSSSKTLECYMVVQ